MKKYLLTIVFIAFVGSITAQTNYIDGVWKLTEMNEAGEVYKVNMHLIFNKTGEIEMSGENVGTWSQNETENTFSISCPYLGILEGENKIEALNDTELKISNANGDINKGRPTIEQLLMARRNETTIGDLLAFQNSLEKH